MNRNGRTRSGLGKPQVLDARDVPSLAKYIHSKKCVDIMLMLGAGVSTSAGIPDFRSPETGLYSNLARLNLPHPEAVFEINFFRRNPVPFYTLAHELYPGKFRPTLTHSFIRLLAEKDLLHTCFTQNIDTLERRAGVPGDKIIEAHGSFATQRCIYCEEPFDDERMKEHILAKKIAKCDSCGGYVKPDIVFFGEALPQNFIHAVPNLKKADLLIVMGTSLTVQPFASLAERVDDTCPRVLINLDRVGSFGSRTDDVVLLGKCDEVVRELCKELGWEDELDRLWADTESSVLTNLTDTKLEPKGGPSDVSEKSDALQEIEKQLEELGFGPEDASELHGRATAPDDKADDVKAEIPAPSKSSEDIASSTLSTSGTTESEKNSTTTKDTKGDKEVPI